MDGNYQQILKECQRELDQIEEWINNHRLESINQYLQKYAIIRSAGALEVVFKQMIFDHLIQNANDEARNYFEKNIIQSSVNVKTGAIQKMLDQINSTWSIAFQNAMKDKVNEPKKAGLNSLVSNRNAFGHGGIATVGIYEIKKYFSSGWEVMEIVFNIIHDIV